MDIVKQVSSELNIDPSQAAKTLALLDQGDSIPFIARYRKEATDGMEDEVIRSLYERVAYLRKLEDRKTAILKSIEEQGKLTDQLKEAVNGAMAASLLEDIYRPYKPKRQTKGQKAIEAGFAPLAAFIRSDKTGKLDQETAKYLDKLKEGQTKEDALQAAFDILAEEIADKAEYRAFLKDLIQEEGVLTATKTKTAASDVYDSYADFKIQVSKIKPYQTLAIFRGEAQKCLAKALLADAKKTQDYILSKEVKCDSPYKSLFATIVADAYLRLIKPSVDTDVFNSLFEVAEVSSIATFKLNLRQLLMQMPLKGQNVLGYDPGYINGCKLAVIDEKGDVLDTSIVYPTVHKGLAQKKDAQIIAELIKKHKITYIALGNGTASRESEAFLKEILKDFPSCHLVIVSEAGASVYSASKLGIGEFPDYDVSLRSAISIARRLLDPLSELVKIDPEAIGVGQYQHDMDQKRLQEALKGVVEDCVNAVGVDVNIASPSLLSYISGIGPSLAEEICSYRKANGKFVARTGFKKVKGFGPKAFKNAAGFLRIKNGKEPLDNTGIHPESYKSAVQLLKKLSISDLKSAPAILNSLKKEDISSMADEIGIGSLTLSDIVQELIKPARDPREGLVLAKLDSLVTSISDLKEGMILEGTVRNIMDFGCFVDIGIHDDGLVHISELADHYVKNVSDEVKIGDIVRVMVISVDPLRKRIGLSIKRAKTK